MARLETALVALFFACWLVVLLSLLGAVPLAGNLHLSLRGLFGTAAGLGWLAGNVYVARSRRLPRALKRRVLVVYFVGPLGIVYLLRAMAPALAQAAAPLAPIYGAGVFGVLFLVPLVLRPRYPRPPAPRPPTPS